MVLPDEVPGPAQRRGEQLGNIVRVATAGDAGPRSPAWRVSSGPWQAGPGACSTKSATPRSSEQNLLMKAAHSVSAADIQRPPRLPEGGQCQRRERGFGLAEQHLFGPAIARVGICGGIADGGQPDATLLRQAAHHVEDDPHLP